MTERTQVAKKKSATKPKMKTATRSKATSKKKTTAKAVRSKPAAVKKVSAKKSAAKKAPTKKTTKKKTVVKKTPAKKAAPKKTGVKKTGVKKTAAKKPATKPSKKSAPAKKTATKKPATKKTSLKKAPKKSGGKAPAKAASPKKKGTPRPKAKDERYTLTEARAAASGLAARAGLKIVRAHTSDEPEEKSKTRRLKKSPLSKPNLEKYREILLQKRSEVAGDVNAMESEAFGAGDSGGIPQRQDDQSSDEYEQALSLGLAETQRRLLVEINEALVRIQDGTYGICILTGGPIGRHRLDATPWTKLSLEGAREQDRQNFYK